MSEIEGINLATQMRCTFCLQELSFMTDPRQLHCGHVFCLQCLQSDYANEEKRCRVCRTPFDAENIVLLPKVSLATELEEKNTSDTSDEPQDEKQNSHMCDICKVDTPAVSFCKDCKKKICYNHLKHHMGFFEDTHRTLDMSAYTTSEFCDQHSDEKLCLGCESCFKLACAECETEICEKDLKEGRHNYVTLRSISDIIQSKYDEKLEACSDQITKLCKREKEAWRNVDQFNKDCDEMVAKVNQAVEEQVAAINRTALSILTEISEYKKSMSDTSEAYFAELHTNLSKLEEHSKSVKRYIKQSTVKETAFHSENKFKQLDDMLSTTKGIKELDTKHTKQLKRASTALYYQSPHRSPEYSLEGIPLEPPMKNPALAATPFGQFPAATSALQLGIGFAGYSSSASRAARPAKPKKV